jgi:undecaprenyl-diphosphatase
MAEHLDQQLFLFLNATHSPFWDTVMHFMSMVLVWIPLYLVIIYCIIRKYKRKFIVIFFVIAASVGITDQSAYQIKKGVGRYRPCHEPSLQGLVHLVDGKCGGTYGFVSSHAANSFNIALISLLFLRRKWFTLFILLWATTVGYSRIYLGVHYPLDVICGALLGSLVGWGMYRCYCIIEKKFLENNRFFNPGS